MAKNDPKPHPRQKGQSRSERAKAIQATQARKERMGKAVLAGGAAAAAILLVAAIFFVIQGRDTTGQAADQVPGGVNDDFGVVLGDDAAPTTVTVYEDFQCPICGQFEKITSEDLAQGVEDGNIKLELRMVSFLDQASSNEYSSRAMNAALAVLDTTGPEAFKEFHDALFANQPAENGPGPEDDELVDMAVEAGAEEDAVRADIEDKVYGQWIENATDAMSKNDVTGTPTVFIDGKKIDGVDEGAQRAIEAAQGDAS